MGKLRSPHSPPSQSAPSTTFPRMDPPPPYEASSSRSSSVHSNEPLNGDGDNQAPRTHDQVPTPSEPSQSQRETASTPAGAEIKRKTEEGCLTFGDGASGCMVYGKASEGCLLYGDHANGCMNYGDHSEGWYVLPVVFTFSTSRRPPMMSRRPWYNFNIGRGDFVPINPAIRDFGRVDVADLFAIV